MLVEFLGIVAHKTEVQMDPVAIVQVRELECCKLVVSDDTAKTYWLF